MSSRGNERQYNGDISLRRVRFVIYAPHARDVYLAGDFNHWDAGSTPMVGVANGKKGFWSVEIELSPGSYQYNFLIDGQWIYKVPGGVVVDKVWVQDTLAAELVLGPYGTSNCLITFR